MTAPKKLLLLAGVVAIGVMLWPRRTENVTRRAADHATERTSTRSARAITDASARTMLDADRHIAATRREAAAFIRAQYRREQLTRELDLEQRRYGRNYWDAESDGRGLAALRVAREAMLVQLNTEANDVLNNLLPGETGGSVTLTAFFDADHPGPNVAFLSIAARERFEAALLAGVGGTGVDAGQLVELAVRVLSPDELELYRKWNEPAAAALRRQLVGFDPTESEFVAILRDAQAAGNDSAADGSAPSLEMQLGAARFNALVKVRDPAMQTALHDLNRLGLPLENAGWLAASREQAVVSIQEVWQSEALPDALKQRQVAQLERAHAQAINSKLNLSGSSLDGLGSPP